MKIDAAKQAGSLAAQIESAQALLAQVDLVIAENWPVTIVRATAPDQGASMPSGTTVDLLHGIATPEMWKTAVSSARNSYQAELDKLLSQLGAM